MKKTALTVAIVCLTVVFAFGFAHADVWVNNCKVTNIGPNQLSGKIMIALQDMDGTPDWTGSRWFMAHATYAKEMLALGLTAVTSNINVRAYVDTIGDGGASIGTIKIMYMVQ